MTERLHTDPAVEPANHPHQVADPRVYLAAERTFLAWVRTSLALMGFGFLIARFAFLMHEPGVSAANPPNNRAVLSPTSLGFGIVCFGVVVCVMSLIRHREYVRALDRGEANPPLNSRAPLIVAAVLALVGLAMAVHVFSL